MPNKAMSIQKRSFIYYIFFLFALSNSGCSNAPSSGEQSSTAVIIDKSSLIQTILQNQKITYRQAQEGSRALLTISSCKLSPASFSKITDATPDSDMIFSHYTSATPMPDKSKLKDSCGYLIRSFKKQGLNCKMIPTFASLITAYLEETGHTEAARLFHTSIADAFSERARLMMNSLTL